MSATAPAPGAVAAQETGAPAVPSPPVYADVEGFVVGFLAPTIARKLVAGGRGLTWCPQWWNVAATGLIFDRVLDGSPTSGRIR